MSRRVVIDASTRAVARSLPLSEWPDAERAAWEHARRKSVRLKPGGAASYLGDEYCKDLVRRYGQFLNYCKRNGYEHGEPGSLVTPVAVAGFVDELQVRVRATTLAQSIYKISRMGRLIAPKQDFSWLAEIAKDLALVAVPMDKLPRVMTTERLVEAGLTLVKQAEISSSGSPHARSLMARNGLMVAVLALCPIRLKNFATLKIGHSLVELEGTWWVILRRTKSRRPDERRLPTYLNGAIQRYLDVHRPVLVAGAPGDDGFLWIGRCGLELSSSQVARSVSVATLSTLGVEISPHLFRACAATTAALHGNAMPHLASALLQHTGSSTIDEHYDRANSLSVGGDFATLIRSL